MIAASSDIVIPDEILRTTQSLWRTTMEHARTRKIRTIAEFAAEEIIIPEGKYEGRKWRPRYQPYSALLLNEFDNPQWSTFATTGCVQSGKSLSAFVIPAIYHLVEMREPVVLAAPTIDVAHDKWRLEIEPVFRKTRYASLLPDTGSGSRGGFAELIELRNGAVIKFMSGGGGDEKRSSFSTRVVIITEADKMDLSGAASREASPIRQLIARTEQWDIGEARVYIECTVSIEEGFIWTAYNAGSKSRLLVPCCSCRGWVCPEREHLTGIQDAETIEQAESQAAFFCPACGILWTEDQRQEMLQEMKLVHKEQSIDAKTGEVVGPKCTSRMLGFRWSAFQNAFSSTAKIANREYAAMIDKSQDDAEKYMRQFYWTLPFVPDEMEVTRLNDNVVLDTTGAIRHKMIPHWGEIITCGIDVGIHWLHWVIMAWRKNLGNCPEDQPASGVIDYGSHKVEEGQIDRSIESAIRGLIAQIDQGYPMLNPDGTVSGSLFSPAIGIIDARHQTRAVRAAVKACDHRVWHTLMGFGSGKHYSQSYSPPKKAGRTIIAAREGYHIEHLTVQGVREFKVDVDYWKSWIHRRFSENSGPGSCQLWHGHRNTHSNFLRHLQAEEEVRYFDVKRNKLVSKWEAIRKQNHYLDATVYAAVGADRQGVTVLEAEHEESQRVSAAMTAVLQSAKDGIHQSPLDSYFGRRQYESES